MFYIAISAILYPTGSSCYLCVSANIDAYLRIKVIAYSYFAPSATKEMLDEWRPLICPTDVTMSKAITYLELFLPTLLPPELFDQEYRYLVRFSFHQFYVFSRFQALKLDVILLSLVTFVTL